MPLLAPSAAPVRRGARAIAAPVAVVLAVVFALVDGGTAATAEPRTPWTWPLAGFRLEQAYLAPAHEYGPGHRGIDLWPLAGFDVYAPAAGTVAFAAEVAERGILTIDHGDGLVTTFEPIASELSPGDPVSRGQAVGTIDLGGHARPGALHFGVRLDGDYINPLLLLGGVPRAVLLPCC